MTGQDVRLLLVVRVVSGAATNGVAAGSSVDGLDPAGDVLQVVFRQFDLAALDQSVGRSRFLVGGGRLLVGLDVPCRHIAFLLLRTAGGFTGGYVLPRLLGSAGSISGAQARTADARHDRSRLRWHVVPAGSVPVDGFDSAGDVLQLVFRQFALAALDQSVGRSRFPVGGSRLLVGLDVPCRHIAFLLLRTAGGFTGGYAPRLIGSAGPISSIHPHTADARHDGSTFSSVAITPRQFFSLRAVWHGLKRAPLVWRASGAHLAAFLGSADTGRFFVPA